LHAPAPRPARSRSIPVFLNAKAGGKHARGEAEKLRQAFADAGADADVRLLGEGEDLSTAAREALKARPEVMVAAGGDGTVSTVADAVRGTQTALGVVPAGTLNHFAKDLGIPLDMAEAVRVIVAGRRASVDVGEVNGRAFINNASLGLYPKLVAEREKQQRRFGRSKRAAMLWAALAVLRRPPRLALRLETAKGAVVARAPFVFVGINDYAMEGFGIGTRARLDAGCLDVYTTRRTSTAGLLGLALRALFGRLRQADDFLEAQVRTLRVESRRARLEVGVDGELLVFDTPLEFALLPRALQVMVP
jgi:diacylglycerol kinase family enzyme